MGFHTVCARMTRADKWYDSCERKTVSAPQVSPEAHHTFRDSRQWASLIETQNISFDSLNENRSRAAKGDTKQNEPLVIARGGKWSWLMCRGLLQPVGGAVPCVWVKGSVSLGDSSVRISHRSPSPLLPTAKSQAGGEYSACVPCFHNPAPTNKESLSVPRKHRKQEEGLDCQTFHLDVKLFESLNIKIFISSCLLSSVLQPRNYIEETVKPVFWFPAVWNHLLESSHRYRPLRVFGFLRKLF